VAYGCESTFVQRLDRWPVIAAFLPDPDGYSSSSSDVTD